MPHRSSAIQNQPLQRFREKVLRLNFGCPHIVEQSQIDGANRSAELLGSVAGATLPALIPVVTLFLGIVVLGETAGAGEFASAILVTSGLALILVGKPMMRRLSRHLPCVLIEERHPLGNNAAKIRYRKFRL